MKIMKMLRGGGWNFECVFKGFEKLVSNCKSIDSWPPKRLIFTWLCSRRSLTPVIPAAQREIKFPFVYISLNICDLLDSLQETVSVFFYFLFELVDLIFVVNEFCRKVGGRYFVAGGEIAGCRHIFTGLNHKHDYRQNWTKWSSVTN